MDVVVIDRTLVRLTSLEVPQRHPYFHGRYCTSSQTRASDYSRKDMLELHGERLLTLTQFLIPRCYYCNYSCQYQEFNHFHLKVEAFLEVDQSFVQIGYTHDNRSLLAERGIRVTMT